ncbi:metal transporter CNNM2-like [Montipora capricornis]|uniref:metal transporter CNNM2-like n=1 Tax=Montipora capricornis TaxID=246305 RepID=UPI0035F154B5
MAAIFAGSVRIYMITICLLSSLSFFNFVKCEVRLVGVSPVDGSSKIENGIVEITAETSVLLRFYGERLSRKTRIAFTSTAGKFNSTCDSDRTKPFTFNENGLRKLRGEAEVILPFGGPFFICLQPSNGSNWFHQGDDKGLQVKTTTKTFPQWLEIVFIVILVCLSGLFSGLNLGLMALDPTELKIVMNCGNANEQSYAKAIQPIRKHGNYLLCTLLLGNVLVNTSFTVLLDGIIGDGIAAVLGSTAGIVIFGEIIPQSICSRHGLAVGARTIWITRFFMLITFPVSFPISAILNCILGNEIGTVYNRKQLQEMLKVQAEFNDLEGDEMNIISGVLNYKSKTVEEVMTKLEDCYLLDLSAVLDFRTIASIMQSGHSRIPVYDGERHNIVGLLLVKDLALIDSDDCTPLRTVIKFYNHQVQKVFNDVHLDAMLEEFKKGHSHLAVVQCVNNEGSGDPFYEAIGIVTLEDILEEIIQSEIVDETDIYLDNKSGKVIPGRKKTLMRELSLFTEDEDQPKVSHQLQLAILQYLNTALEVFSEDVISLNVLKRLISQPKVIHELKLQDGDDNKFQSYLYRKDMVADYFILIIQGKVEVIIGQEALTFEEGPFSSFGTNALVLSLSNSNVNLKGGLQYIPDYTVRAITDIMYLKIPKALYKRAVQTTLMERQETRGMDGLQDRSSVSNGPGINSNGLYIESTC